MQSSSTQDADGNDSGLEGLIKDLTESDPAQVQAHWDEFGLKEFVIYDSSAGTTEAVKALSTLRSMAREGSLVELVDRGLISILYNVGDEVHGAVVHSLLRDLRSILVGGICSVRHGKKWITVRIPLEHPAGIHETDMFDAWNRWIKSLTVGELIRHGQLTLIRDKDGVIVGFRISRFARVSGNSNYSTVGQLGVLGPEGVYASSDSGPPVPGVSG